MMRRAAFGRREKAKPERSLSLPNARALQDSEARISSIFRAVPAGIGLVVNRVIMEANDRLCEMTGYTREELIGKSARILYLTDEDYEFVGCEKYRQIAEHGTGTVETRWRRRDGRIIEIILSSTPIRPGDATAGITFTALDITDRKRVEDARRLDEQRLEALLRLSQMSEASLQEITDFALEEGVRLTGSEIGYLAFMSEDETVLRMHSWSKSTIAWCSVSDRPVLYPVASTGLWGEAVRQRRPVITNDYTALNPLKKGCPEGHVEIRRHMNVPILDGGRIVAVAGVGNKAGEYDESDVRQLTLLMQGMWRLVQRKRAADALRAGEERFRVIFEGSVDGIVLFDESGRILKCNTAFEQMIGYGFDELRDMMPYQYTYPEDIAVERADVRNLIAGKRDRYLREKRYVRKDGRVFWAQLSISRVQFEGDQVYFVAIVSDVDERKRSEEALRKSEERYRMLVEHAPLGIFTCDLQGNITSINPMVLELMGSPSPEFTKSVNLLGFEPLTRSGLTESIKKCLSCGESTVAEGSYTSYWGKSIYMRSHLTPLRDSAGRMFGMLGIIEDITERRRAEVALRESERKFRGVIEQASEGFILVDEAGRIIEYNSSAERIYGWKREEIIGMAFWDYMYMLIPEERRGRITADDVRRMIEEYQREGHGTAMGGRSSVNEVNCAGGSRRFTQTINFPIRTDKGHMIGNIVVDITEQKRAEDALRESEEKFRVLTETTASAIVILQDNRVKYANPAVEKITGYSREEMLAMGPVEAASIIDPASILMLNLARFRRRGKNENLRYEIRLKAKGGKTKWVDVTTGVISYNGSPAFLATGLDITERKQAEDELKSSEAKFRALFEKAGAAIFVADVATVAIIDCNMKAGELIGRPREEIIGLHQTQLHPADNAKLHSKMFLSHVRADDNNYETVVQHKDGRAIPVMINGAALKVEGREIMIGFFLDITESRRAEEEVQNARNMLRLIMDNIPQGIFWKDRSSVYLGCNSVVARDVGIGSPEDIVGKTDHDLPWLPGQADEIREHDRKVMKSDTPEYNIIEPLQLTGGEPSWIEASKIPLHDAAGNVIGVLGTYEDITERRRAEGALRESEEKFRGLAETSSAMIMMYQGEFFIFANQAAERISGYSRDELLRMHFWDMIHPEFREMVKERGLARLLGEDVPSKYELKILTKSGGVLWAECTVGLIEYRGRPAGIATIFDITERKRAEDTLKRNQFILAKSQETAHLGNWAWNVQTDELDGSAENWRIVGFSPGELRPTMQLYQQLVHPEDRDTVARLIESVRREGRKCSIDYRVKRLDGSILYVNTVADKIVRDEKGDIKWVYGINQDITERKTIEEMLAKAKADAELYLDLMSHDINNMNQAGIGFLELAHDLFQREGRIEMKDRFLVEKPLEALWNSSNLIKSVRKLQRISTDEFSDRVFDLHQVMADVYKRYGHVLDRDLTLKVSFNYSTDTHFYVRANDLINDIFDNLINNAIKHSDPEKPLVVTLGLKTVEQGGRRYHRATVEDDGPGIPDALKEKLFSRFQRGYTKASGKGLGLYIVKALVEKYGGSVGVEDRVPGDCARGARFVVMLPTVQEKPDNEIG